MWGVEFSSLLLSSLSLVGYARTTYTWRIPPACVKLANQRADIEVKGGARILRAAGHEIIQSA